MQSIKFYIGKIKRIFIFFLCMSLNELYESYYVYLKVEVLKNINITK